MDIDRLERLENKIDALMESISIQNAMLREILQDQEMLKRMYEKSEALTEDDAFMINVNANLWASLFERYYWGKE